MKNHSSVQIYESERDRFFILGLSICLSLAFIGGIFLDSDVPNDSLEYLQMARNILNEATFYAGDLSEPIIMDSYTKRPPLYPVFLGFSSLLGAIPYVTYFLQTFFVFCGLYLMRNLGFYAGYKQSFDKYFLISVVFLPSIWIYPQLMMSEAVFFFFISLITFAAAKSYFNSSPAWAAMSLLLLSISAFVKPITFPLAIVLSIIFVFIGIWKKYKRVVLSSVLSLFLILGYMWMNQKRTGAFHFSSISTINLVNYNAYYLTMKIDGPEAASEQREDIYGSLSDTMTYDERLEERFQAGKNVILKNPVEYGVSHFAGIGKFFLFPGRYDVYTFFGLEQGEYVLDRVMADGYIEGIKEVLSSIPLWLLLLIGGSFVIKSLLLVGAISFFFSNVPWQIKLLCGGILFYIAFLTGPIGAARFFMPVSGVYIIISVLGYIYLNKMYKKI